MTATPIVAKSFRYRNGKESNRKVLITAQNQNSLRGFDVSDMTDSQIQNMTEKWSKVQNQKWSLTAKESNMIKNHKPAQGRFKTFKTSKIRYFHAEA